MTSLPEYLLAVKRLLLESNSSSTLSKEDKEFVEFCCNSDEGLTPRICVDAILDYRKEEKKTATESKWNPKKENDVEIYHQSGLSEL